MHSSSKDWTTNGNSIWTALCVSFYSCLRVSIVVWTTWTKKSINITLCGHIYDNMVEQVTTFPSYILTWGLKPDQIGERWLHYQNAWIVDSFHNPSFSYIGSICNYLFTVVFAKFCKWTSHLKFRESNMDHIITFTQYKPKEILYQ